MKANIHFHVAHQDYFGTLATFFRLVQANRRRVQANLGSAHRVAEKMAFGSDRRWRPSTWISGVRCHFSNDAGLFSDARILGIVSGWNDLTSSAKLASNPIPKWKLKGLPMRSWQLQVSRTFSEM
jgi:hypothetical protein